MLPSPSATSVSVGLFGVIGATGHVSNLTLTNASITANPNAPPPGQFVGILAGANAGTISNVGVTGTVTNGSVQNGVIAGGLVGQNGIFGPGASMGTITNAVANVTVTVGNTTGVADKQRGRTRRRESGHHTDCRSRAAPCGAARTASSAAWSRVNGPTGASNVTSLATVSAATGDVSVADETGSRSAADFVGFNFGQIGGLVATGITIRTSTAASIYRPAHIGGLVGQRSMPAGSINDARSPSGTDLPARKVGGGLVGSNNGTISNGGAGGTSLRR